MAYGRNRFEEQDDMFIIYGVVFLVFMIMSIVFKSHGGCDADPVDSERILRDEGYTNIQFTGYQWFECGEHDYYNQGFDAIRNMPDGTVRHVHGVICCGAMKACTIRH